MKVSKWNDKLKNHHNGCDLPFWNGFECCVNSLVPQTTKHTHVMVEWCMTTMVLPIYKWSTTNTQQRDGKHQFMNHKKKDKETKEWRVWLFFLPKTPLFHSSITVLAVSSLTYNHPFPSFSGWFHEWEKPTQVWWVWCFGKHLMVCVWMVLMSHNEPLHNHNTHQVCLPAFHSLCFPFTSIPTQMVFMWWSLQWCAQPFNQWHVPSTSLSNTITPSPLPPIQQTHTTWDMSSQ